MFRSTCVEMAPSLSTKCLAFLLTNVESSKIKLFNMSGNEGIYILFLFFTTEFVTVFNSVPKFQLVSCLVIFFFFHTPSYLLKVYVIFVLWRNI